MLRSARAGEVGVTGDAESRDEPDPEEDELDPASDLCEEDEEW
jgi:hypothetical protein